MNRTVAKDAKKIYASIARLPARVYQAFIMRAADNIKKATTTNPLSLEAFTEDLRNFWKNYVKEDTTKRQDNEATAMATMLQGKKSWKKFQGKCNFCRVIGHKKAYCYKFMTTNRQSNDRNNCNNRNGRGDTRKCCNCNQYRHILRNCLQRRRETMVSFVGMIEIINDEDDKKMANVCQALNNGA